MPRWASAAVEGAGLDSARSARNCPPDDPYFATAPWIDAQILPPPTTWGGGLPDDKIPAGTHGFDPDTGQPPQWPMRLSKVHWAVLLPGLPPGKYTLRCRTVDEKGHGQPMPRPFRKSGHASIEQVAIVVRARRRKARLNPLEGQKRDEIFSYRSWNHFLAPCPGPRRDCRWPIRRSQLRSRPAKPGELQLGVTYTLWIPGRRHEAPRHHRASARLRHRRVQRGARRRPTICTGRRWPRNGTARCWARRIIRTTSRTAGCGAIHATARNKTFCRHSASWPRSRKHPELETVPWCLWGIPAAASGPA